MRIHGPSQALPLHAARAYGMKVTRPQPASGACANDVVAQVRSAGRSAPSPAASPLVAARVLQSPAPDRIPALVDSSLSPRPQALRLYSRAADQVEAAVAIELGRIIDFRG